MAAAGHALYMEFLHVCTVRLDELQELLDVGRLDSDRHGQRITKYQLQRTTILRYGYGVADRMTPEQILELVGGGIGVVIAGVGEVVRAYRDASTGEVVVETASGTRAEVTQTIPVEVRSGEWIPGVPNVATLLIGSIVAVKVLL